VPGDRSGARRAGDAVQGQGDDREGRRRRRPRGRPEVRHPLDSHAAHVQGWQSRRADRWRCAEGEVGRVAPQTHLDLASGGGVLGHFLKPEYEELIAQKDWESLRVAFEDLHPADIADVLHDLPPEDSGVIFRILPREVAGTAFEYLPLD